MSDIATLAKLARRIVGRDVPVEKGVGAYTDGSMIMTIDADSRWPKLSVSARCDMEKKSTAHEAGHIVLFERAAKKLGRASLSSEEFYQEFADPCSPGSDSQDYVRYLLNVVEDRLADGFAAQAIGTERTQEVNRFYVWNRQGGTRKSLAELEASGSSGRCAAFVEAIFQLEIYGELIESFFSTALANAAEEATKTIVSFGQGSLSRTQALQAVITALRKYCPPPWKLPVQYQPPRGEGSGKGGDPAAKPQGAAQGQGEQLGQGDGQGQGEGSGQNGAEGDGQGQQNGDGDQAGDGEDGQNQNGEAEGEGDQGNSGADGGENDLPANAKEKEDGSEDPDPGSESEGGGNGSPSETNSRGSGGGESPNAPRTLRAAAESRFEDNDLEALLRMLERVLAERAKQMGRGIPRFQTWQPGDAVSSPDEICRYEEDEVFGIDPLQRRCVRRRDREKHLLAVFIDSSGSVNDKLFAQLYRVCGELAEKVAALEGCYLGVGQFSGGASWVLEPTRDVCEIRDFAEETAKRLYSGGTTVGEIYGLLPEWFAGYETADLIVLTDGFVEHGKKLAASLERAHENTTCEIKLHGVVFKGKGSLKQFSVAKDEMPQHVRLWHLGEK